MKPAPRQVAKTVTQILRSVWPQGLDEGLPWLEAMGIRTDTATETPRRRSSRSWHMASMPTWGTARAGWGTYQDRFADVFWFLWDDESSERVLHAATELADHLADALGEPTETTEPTPLSGGTWWWQLEGHSIEMYAYTDARTPDGHPTGPPCVQLSVDLREVSDPREAEARRLQGAPGFG